MLPWPFTNLKVGSKLPAGDLWENNPGEKVSVHELFAGKKGILIGVFKLSVTGAWAKDLKAEGKVRILADPAGNFAKVKCLVLTISKIRRKR